MKILLNFIYEDQGFGIMYLHKSRFVLILDIIR
jgi:hypothetical protein